MAPVLLVSLVGCGAFGPDPIPPSPTVTEAAAVETPTAVPYPTVPDGVVATGAFESAAAETTGTVTVTKRGDQFTVSVDNFEMDFDGQVSFVLSDKKITPGMCAEHGNYQIAYAVEESTDKLPTIKIFHGSDDPSYLETASIVQYPDGTDVGGCAQPFLGIATLDWTLPDMRPDLVLEDSGSRTGAHGIITEDGDYYTTSGDVWSEIADRFGITPDELEWLNPIRPSRKMGVAYDDEVLNLSKSHRGDSQKRLAYVYDGTLGTLPTQ